MSQFVKDAIRTESPNFFMHKVDPRILHASIGFVTEAGEFQDALKKTLFYGEDLDLTNLKEELGDMLWYMAIAMDALGTDFEDEQDRVIRKLKKRFPSKFENALAEEVNRDRKAERKILETEKPAEEVVFKKLFKVVCEWDIGLEGILYQTESDAMNAAYEALINCSLIEATTVADRKEAFHDYREDGLVFAEAVLVK